MQRTSVERTTIVHEIVCDRCGARALRHGVDNDFERMTSIGFTTRDGSIFGPGKRVEIDLCEPCLRSALGGWLRVRVPAEGEVGAALAADLAADLSVFDPRRHGGEFPAGDAQGPNEVFDSVVVAHAKSAFAEMPAPIPDIGVVGMSSGENVSGEPGRRDSDGNHGALIMKLWTTTVEYGASGEGETRMAWIGYAEDAAEAKAELIKVFNAFHGAFGVAVEGVARNDVTELLFSQEALNLMERLDGRATVHAYAMLHFNRA